MIKAVHISPGPGCMKWVIRSCIYLSNSDFSQKIIDCHFQSRKVGQDMVIIIVVIIITIMMAFLHQNMRNMPLIFIQWMTYFFSFYLQNAENLPELIERTVFHTYGRLINNTYKRKMRSLVFTLKHRDTIREKVIGGEITVKKLVTSSVDELIACANENSNMES